MDLSQFTEPELRALHRLVSEDIAQRERASLVLLRDEIRSAIHASGFTLTELQVVQPLRSNKRPKSRREWTGAYGHRYRNPTDAAQTWTRLEPMPEWVVDYLGLGG